MTKQKFKPYKLEDLTGGINTRDYPSEIEDKQSIDLNNWNFKGNKLVSGFGIDKVYSGDTDSPIQGLTVDGKDIWSIQNGNLFKNGDLQYYNNKYTLTIGNIDGEIWSINIDGNSKTFKIGFLNNEEFARNTLETELINWLGSEYVISYNSGGEYSIRKTDGGIINFSNPSLVRTATLSGFDSVAKITVNIDGVETTVDGSTYTLSQALNYIISQLPINTYYTSISGGTITIARIDGVVPSISSTQFNRYTYYVLGRSSTITPSYINLGIPNFTSAGVSVYNIKSNIGGNTYTYTYPTGLYREHSSFLYNYETYGTITENNKDQLWGLYVDYLYKNLPYTKYGIANVGTSGVNFRGVSFSFYDTDYAQVNISNQSISYVDYNNSEYLTNGININYTGTNHLASFIVGVKTEVTRSTQNNGIEIELYDRYNISISSYGILLTGYRAFNPTIIENNGTTNNLSISSVGRPTLGIIYNGKTILGGYKGKDNIVFSKTEDPVTTANELIDFSGYSSGGQSVSGGNKGEIKGFIVGENGLYVFKENEVWYSNSEKDTGTSFNFLFKKITSTGASGQNAICEVEQEIFYFDYINRAVRRLGYEKDLTTLRDVAVSREIEDILAEIPEDHEGNNERFSNLINLSYKYPYLELNYPDSSAPYVYYNLADEDQKYRIPNKTLVYNTENKSWSKRSDKEYTNKYALHSHKGYYGTQNGNIYSSVSSNTSENGDSLSKEYTYGDDSAYKKIGRFDVVGKIIPDSGQSKTLTIKILLDDVEIDERVITATTTQRVIERIDLYDIGQRLQFKLQHSGSGRVEIYDVTPYIKGTNIQTDY